MPGQSLPVLDLRRFATGHPGRADFLVALRKAAREFGFFYLIGHGISPQQSEEVLASSRRFFALPEVEKLSIQMIKSAQFRGYNRAGAEYTRGQQDWREQVDFGADKPALSLKPGDPVWKRLQGPNQYLTAQPDLKPVIETWIADVTKVGLTVLKALATALGQPEDIFEPIYRDGPNQLMKLIRYPGRDQTISDQGVGPHKDSGFLTLLLQDKVAGLQVRGSHGWIDAPPLPGSFVVNVGELLELASSGYLKANVHRVVSPPGDADRLSVAFFLGASPSSTVPVLTLASDLAAQVTGITVDPLNPLFRDVGQNFLKSRLRSHPDVARAHHADLLESSQLNGELVASAY